MKYTKKDFANDLYDLIKINFLKDKQTDNYAELSRKFAKEAKSNLKKYLSHKEICVSNNIIIIGKINPITILLDWDTLTSVVYPNEVIKL